MRLGRSVPTLVVIVGVAVLSVRDALAQNPPTTGAPPGQRGAAPPAGGGGGGQRRGGGGGGRGVTVMTMTTTGWTDGGQIPLKHSQVGSDVSPAFTWTDPPPNTASFVLLVQDADQSSNTGFDGTLHWLVWNIPATVRGLAENFPQGPQQTDGTRQISVSGPYYRGPAAPATGPPHHYTFELFALDTVLAVEPVGQPVAMTRSAVLAAMAGHVRGKAMVIGTFRRPE